MAEESPSGGTIRGRTKMPAGKGFEARAEKPPAHEAGSDRRRTGPANSNFSIITLDTADSALYNAPASSEGMDHPFREPPSGWIRNRVLPAATAGARPGNQSKD